MTAVLRFLSGISLPLKYHKINVKFTHIQLVMVLCISGASTMVYGAAEPIANNAVRQETLPLLADANREESEHQELIELSNFLALNPHKWHAIADRLSKSDRAKLWKIRKEMDRQERLPLLTSTDDKEPEQEAAPTESDCQTADRDESQPITDQSCNSQHKSLALPVGAQTPSDKMVTLKSQDGWTFTVPQEIAKMATTIKNVIEDRSVIKEIIKRGPGSSLPIADENLIEENIYHLNEVTIKTFMALLPLMKLAHSTQQESAHEQMQMMAAKVKTIFTAETIEDQARLVNGIEYLGINVPAKLLADTMITNIHERLDGDRDMIEEMVSSLRISDGFRELLAKFWYLLYGTGRLESLGTAGNQKAHFDYILPNLNYGFSIAELATYKKLLPFVSKYPLGTLDLTDFRINDLTGLSLIPDLESIKILKIRCPRITKMPGNIFMGFNKLRDLDLSCNRITTLEENVLSGLSDLGELNLSQNKLNSLPKNLFKGLQVLEKADLSHNQLTTLPKDMFGDNHVYSLDLSYNQLTKLPKKMFRGNYNLSSLDLSHNRFSTMPIYWGLELLWSLDLSCNLIASLGENALRGYSELHKLNLSHNKLNALPEGIFQYSSLSRIDLSENEIAELPQNIFRNTVMLASINLARNQLTALPENLFKDHVWGFITLEVQHNNIQTVPRNIFDKRSRSFRLYLYGNPLSRETNALWRHLWHYGDFYYPGKLFDAMWYQF